MDVLAPRTVHAANKCGLQNVHVAVIGRYLSLSAGAHLSASDNVGSTFFFLPHGSKKTEITGNIYAVSHCNHKDKAGERKGLGGEARGISFALHLALCILQRERRDRNRGVFLFRYGRRAAEHRPERR